jgi:type II secretory ATPase GspE/PulE/Tfp pilus assembly ATPase PilB-like protein
LDETERDLFAHSGLEVPNTLLHPGSCAECNWYGYKGRTGTFEVATVDDELGALISAGAHQRELADCLRGKGVRSMVQDGLDKVARGITSMEELFRVGGFCKPGESQPEQAEPAAVAG